MIGTQSGEPLVDWTWVREHLGDIGDLAVQHVVLTAIAVGVGFVIAMGLSLLAVRYRALYGPIVGVTGTLYTIPSIALFILLVPVTGFTVLTAEIGLVTYTLLILVRNIVAGLDSVPAQTKEAARAMGYRRLRALLAVELPLALPAIVAGLRIATVTTIGLVTITALIGLGGFGRLINDGLQELFTTKLVVGAVLSVALAAIADAAFVGLRVLIAPWSRRR